MEVQDADGQPIEGYSLAECDPVVGDDLDRAVTWGGDGDVGELADSPLRLRFVMKDADVYSLKFKDGQ